jgi:hypothetical protein
MQVYPITFFTDMADLVDHLRTVGLHLVADLGHRRWLRGSGFLAGFGHDPLSVAERRLAAAPPTPLHRHCGLPSLYSDLCLEQTLEHASLDLEILILFVANHYNKELTVVIPTNAIDGG